jgi:hypothetical protein
MLTAIAEHTLGQRVVSATRDLEGHPKATNTDLCSLHQERLVEGRYMGRGVSKQGEDRHPGLLQSKVSPTRVDQALRPGAPHL